MSNPWLPRNYRIDEHTLIGVRKFSGDNWQIYMSSDETQWILLLKSELYSELFCQGYITDTLWKEEDFGNTKFYWLVSDALIIPANEYINAENFSDLMAFAYALKTTREHNTAVNLDDAIYIEQYSKLLPVFESKETADDGLIIGKVLTGGVAVSVKELEKVSFYCDWLDKEAIKKIASFSGINIDEAFVETEAVSEFIGEENTTQKTNYKEKGKFELAGRPALTEFFNDYVIDIIVNSDQYQKMGIDFPSAIILYGPPGCGKTFAVERLVEYLGLPCNTIDSSSIASPYIHQTSKLIAEVFDKAMQEAPSVIVIDEMEAFVGNREDSQKHGKEEVAEFLRKIPEAIKNKVLIIGMTNHLEMIDPAIRRTGRFDNVVEVGYPSKEEIVSLVECLVQKYPASDEVNIEFIAEKLVGKSLSDTDFVIREAARIAAKNKMDAIDATCLDEALSKIIRVEKVERKTIGFK